MGWEIAESSFFTGTFLLSFCEAERAKLWFGHFAPPSEVSLFFVFEDIAVTVALPGRCSCGVQPEPTA